MDVLYLVPSAQSPLACQALDLVQNRAHVQVRSLHLPSSTTPETHVCFCVSVSQAIIDNFQTWIFTLASHEAADLHLPVPSHHDPINVGFVFSVSLEDPFDQPALIVAPLESGVVTVVDPMTEEERNRRVPESIKGQTRFLHQPTALSFGEYAFSVALPDVPKEALPARLNAIRRIADHPVKSIREREWRKTGKHLGTGAFGSVSLVRGMNLGAIRAEKTIGCWADREKEIAAARREVKIMKTLNHSNILRCFESKESIDEETPGTKIYRNVIILQPCHGSLRDLLDRGLAGRYFSALARQMASALAYMHRQQDPVVHRDLKPENILFRIPDGSQAAFNNPYQIIAEELSMPLHFYIADFGLSRQAGPTCQTMCGTPSYMAPEIKGDKRYTSAVDIYALGLTLMDVLDNYAMSKLRANATRNQMFFIELHQREVQNSVCPRASSHPLWWLMHAMVSWNPDGRPSAFGLIGIFEDLDKLCPLNTNFELALPAIPEEMRQRIIDLVCAEPPSTGYPLLSTIHENEQLHIRPADGSLIRSDYAATAYPMLSTFLEFEQNLRKYGDADLVAAGDSTLSTVREIEKLDDDQSSPDQVRPAQYKLPPLTGSPGFVPELEAIEPPTPIDRPFDSAPVGSIPTRSQYHRSTTSLPTGRVQNGGISKPRSILRRGSGGDPQAAARRDRVRFFTDSILEQLDWNPEGLRQVPQLPGADAAKPATTLQNQEPSSVECTAEALVDQGSASEPLRGIYHAGIPSHEDIYPADGPLQARPSAPPQSITITIPIDPAIASNPNPTTTSISISIIHSTPSSSTPRSTQSRSSRASHRSQSVQNATRTSRRRRTDADAGRAASGPAALRRVRRPSSVGQAISNVGQEPSSIGQAADVPKSCLGWAAELFGQVFGDGEGGGDKEGARDGGSGGAEIARGMQ